jgi:hypothetical protein
MTCCAQKASCFAAEQKTSAYERRLCVGATLYPGVDALALHVLSHGACNPRLGSQIRKFTACSVSTGTR